MNPVGIELLDEKDLWSIYRQCIVRLPVSKFNFWSCLTAFLLLLCDSAYFPSHDMERLSLLRSICDAGLGYGATILGFLIAGFTIFTTLSKPEMFERMRQTLHKSSGLSYLKVNLFAFMEVFVVYVFFLIICLSIKLFGSVGALASSLVAYSFKHPVHGYFLSKIWLINVSFVCVGTLAFYCFLSLKSFIYNNYHVVITSVVWAINPSSNANRPD